MLEFAHPELFALLAAPALVWALLPPHREPSVAVRFPFFAELANVAGAEPGEGSVVRRRSFLQGALALIAWALLVTALARPEWVGPPIERLSDPVFLAG